ncbi:hypothetical protein QBC38DRAFT_26713 [Podospora fimiseda]|uniref:Uncharacterized protein n=1 Tax=Podospora fimiseda TaxID=252190 RepID=A0AAN7BIZ5_9PEZI|nr:hypothetical protein QBC38DRAFT_26713 [Podospora fimiseda]
MANQQKQYFLSPTWDYPPGPTSPLSIGNIILSTSKPVPALFQASKSPNYQSLVLDKISQTIKKDVSWTNSKTLSYNFGIWGKFLEFMGAEIGIETSKENAEIFQFESVVTQNFFPDEEYLKEILLKSPVVLRRMQKFRKPVFIVTGVKSVHGAVAKTVWKRNVGLNTSVGVDVVAAATGIPLPISGLEVGPKVGTSKGKGGSSGFGSGGDEFVFAYRVLKVRVRGKGQVSQEEYVRGAMLGVPGAKDGDELVDLEMLEVEDGDEDVKGFESAEGIVEVEEDEGDEEEVKVFLPSRGVV